MEQVSAAFGKSLKARIFSANWLWAPGSTIYDYPLLATLMRRYRGYDLVFEAIGPVIHLSARQTPQFTYVFFPPHPDLMGDGKFRSGFWRLYSAPYRLFYKTFATNVRSTQILSISNYISDLCKVAWGMESDVVYFPVPFEEWRLNLNPSKRDGVITIGRFSSEKNQIEQLQIAEALLAARVDSPVNIVGAVASSVNRQLYWRLRSEASSRALRNVRFFPNLGKQRVIALANHSKVFLHTMRNEHFGIATVEAIAAGCVPLVHDSGGSKEIVPFEQLRYRSSADAAEKVSSALDGEFDKYIPSLQEHIPRFSEAAFKERVTKILLSQ